MTVLDSTIIGPFVQTLFMGASITKFSANVGWNASPSELTVELVEDPNRSSKLYYNGFGNACIHSGPDRFNPPKLGSPAFFKYGSFEFMGILQNWLERSSTAGTVYTVKLTSPHDVLDGTHVILDAYSGPIYNIPNIINVFGYLESNGTLLSPTKTLTVNTDIQTIIGYEPATGFGGAQKNSVGIPWLNIRDALCKIINNMTFADIQTSSWNLSARTDTKYGNCLKLRDHTYIFDVTTLPTLDNTFRFNEENLTLLDLISKVCEYCGADFFVELILVANPSITNGYIGSSTVDNNPFPEGSVDWANYFAGHIPVDSVLKFIKVYPVSRINQPVPAQLLDVSIGSPIKLRLDNIGAITSAINQYAIPMSNKNRGLEFRNETTNCFLIGDYRQDIWQVYCDDGTSTGLPTGVIEVFNGISINGIRKQPFGDPYRDSIFPYWGKDDNGIPIYSSGLLNEHEVDLNLLGKFDSSLEYQISGCCPNYIYKLSAGEISAILTGSKDVWSAWVESDKNPYWNQQVLHKGGNVGWFTTVGIGKINAYTILREDPKKLWLTNGEGKPYYVHISNKESAYNAGLIAAGSYIDNTTMQDKLFEYLKSMVDTYYGKKFLVELPSDACGIILDDEPFSIKTNYEVSDSAWTSLSGILGLGTNSVPMSIFKNAEDGKIQCFVHLDAPNYYEYDRDSEGRLILEKDANTKWFKIRGGKKPGSLDCSTLSKDEYYLHTNSDGYIKADVEEIVFLDPENLLYPRAVISLPQPMYPFDIFLSHGSGNLTYYIKRDWRMASNIELGANIRLGPGQDTAMTYPFMPFPLTPNAVALPLKNNMVCYGPWYINNNSIGANGKTEFIRDTNLSPWNFGSETLMDGAGQIQVASRIMQYQLSEVGGFTMPGAPLINLGRTLILNGPQVTNLDVSVGDDGVQTTYQMRTFTPNYGSFAKSKLDQISRFGRNSNKAVRMLQQAQYEEVVNRKNVKFAGITAWTKSDRFNRASSSNLLTASAERAYIPSGEYYNNDGVYITGQGLMDWEWFNASGNLLLTSGVTNVVVHTDLRKGIPDLAAHNNNMYLKRAGIEQIGLFRPYTTLSGILSNMAEMPISTVQEGSISGWCPDGDYVDSTNNTVSRFAIPPLYSGFFPPICATTLNPFLVPTSGKTRGGWQLTTGVDAAGHDIEYVVRDSGFPNDLAILPTNDYSQYDWYRAIGLKGPLVIVGWGYDVDGRPVPNAKVDASGRGLTQYFEDDWLRKPQDWKAGPLDVRWDQDRGVWCPPQLQTMVRFKCTEDWNSSKNIFRAELQNIPSGYAYDKDGNKLPYPWIQVYDPWKQAICSGMYGWAYYNANLTHTDDGEVLGKHQRYELMSIENPLATIYTTGGGSGTIYSLTMTPPNAHINWNRWHPVKILNAPDVSGYFITAQLTSILADVNPSLSGHLVFVPTDFPMPIEGATITGPLEARITRTGDIRTIRNSLNVSSGIKANIQWNGLEWITINTEGYNTPVLGML